MLCVLAGVLSRPAVSSNDQELLDADLHGYDFDDHDAEVFFADSSSRVISGQRRIARPSCHTHRHAAPCEDCDR